LLALKEQGVDFAAMLYHRRQPCANPAGRPKMTKQQAIRRPPNPEQNQSKLNG
jgi:hypothetical protein